MNYYRRGLLITALLMVLIYMLISLVLLLVSANQARQIKTEVEFVYTSIRNQTNIDLEPHLFNLEYQIEKAQFYARPAGWLEYMPFVRHDYRVYRQVLSIGADFISAGSQVSQTIRRQQINDNEPLKGIGFEDLAVTAVGIQPALSNSIQALASINNEIEKSSVIKLFPTYQQQIGDLQAILAASSGLIQQFEPLLQVIPNLFGVDQDHDVLLILQNPHELRPTGGFIGNYGRVTFSQGRIKTLFTDDIYKLDEKLLGKEKIAAPEAIKNYVNVPYLYLRDANWSPDFPTSAQQITQLYEQASGEMGIDTVIAMTPFVVQEFLAFTGPITVDGVTFTDKNLIDELQFLVEQDFANRGLADRDRKKIINDLAQAMKDRALMLSGDEIKQLVTIVQKSLQSKEILLYSKIDNIQKGISEQGWSGEVRSTAMDYIMVVDANLGALKTDRLVQRQHRYSVTQSTNNQISSELVLNYKNNGYFDYRTGRYRTYTRIYLPLGATITSTEGFMTDDRSGPNAKPLIYSEFNKTVVAGFLAVEPGQQRSIRLTYTLPSRLVNYQTNRQAYELMIQKQPGSSATVDTSVNLAYPMYSFAPSSTPYQTISPSRLNFQTTISADREFTVKYTKP